MIELNSRDTALEADGAAVPRFTHPPSAIRSSGKGKRRSCVTMQPPRTVRSRVSSQECPLHHNNRLLAKADAHTQEHSLIYLSHLATPLLHMTSNNILMRLMTVLSMRQSVCAWLWLVPSHTKPMCIACDQRPPATNGLKPLVADGLWSQAIDIGLVLEGTS